MHDLSQRVRQLAASQGFDRVGILPVYALQDERQRLYQWLAAGHHAGMDWMSRHGDIRLDPSKLFPQAQSVVCVAINYYPGEPKSHQIIDPQEASGDQQVQTKIARYALGADYHRLIRRKLRRVLAALQAEYPDQNIQGRALCDSAPVLERALAERAGIGWRGKHGLTITPTMGSWVFLGELLLTVPLSSDQNDLTVDRCGRCTRCIEACPTDAILPTRSVDARKCIAYWTIEAHEAHIPEPISHHQNGWVFGCDICQEVCPWSLKLETQTTIEDWQHPEYSHAPPSYWLEMSEAAFQEKFAQTPLRRTGLTRLQRNARAVLASKTPGVSESILKR
ncbi:MAG: tRNA epoxyqueuosine(34) reductase QueG [Vampirovibrionales bacterium]|nr:tRNA epoxyqueuosine(34) reductase QueG [Vampirovibrionales bacterium]